MTQKLPLMAASAAAALTLVMAVAATGFVPRQSVTGATDTSATDAAATPTIVVDTLYLAPPPPQQTITVHKVVASTAGASGDGNEPGGED